MKIEVYMAAHGRFAQRDLDATVPTDPWVFSGALEVKHDDPRTLETIARDLAEGKHLEGVSLPRPLAVGDLLAVKDGVERRIYALGATRVVAR